jgi:hypothetical protein
LTQLSEGSERPEETSEEISEISEAKVRGRLAATPDSELL